MGQNGILPVAQAKIEASTAVSVDACPRRNLKHCVRAVILHAKRITKSYSIRTTARRDNRDSRPIATYNAGMMIVCG